MKTRTSLRVRGAALVASALAIMNALATGPAAAEPGTCTVAAGTNGGQKFATLKCAKTSSPNNYFIRSTVWEREDKTRYQELASFAGRSFTCTLTRSGSKKSARLRTIRYKVSNCR